MKRNRAQKLRANVSSDKRLAAKVMLTFSAPLSDKVRGVPSQRRHAWLLSLSQRTMSRVDKDFIEKHRQLSAGEKSIY